jgi:hypothetical protein
MKDNVVVMKAPPDSICFVCDGKLAEGENVVFISFDIPLFVTTVKVTRGMDTVCAAALRDLLDLRVAQARGSRS